MDFKRFGNEWKWNFNFTSAEASNSAIRWSWGSRSPPCLLLFQPENIAEEDFPGISSDRGWKEDVEKHFVDKLTALLVIVFGRKGSLFGSRSRFSEEVPYNGCCSRLISGRSSGKTTLILCAWGEQLAGAVTREFNIYS